jgi:hypothetical protein
VATTTSHKRPAYVRDEAQDTGILVLLLTLGTALLVLGAVGMLFLLTLPTTAIGG